MSEQGRTVVGWVITKAKRAVRSVRKMRRGIDSRNDHVSSSTAETSGPRWQDHPLAAEFAASGTFCAAFYQRVTGKNFADEQEAAAHYLSYSIRKPVPPNPFVAIHNLPDEVKTAMRRRNAAPLIEYLTLPEPANYGPAIDPSYLRQLEHPHEQGSFEELSPMGRFLTTMTETTELPVSPDSPLAGVLASRYTEQVTASARMLRDLQSLRVPRTVTEWDEEAEKAWRARLSQSKLKETPLVSIIMPVKDQADLVGRAIASISAQTYGSWELFVVDDHSTDNTRVVVEELALSEPRISILENDGHGVSAAHNTGIRASHGHYAAFLDPDYVWRPDYLTCMVRAMIRDDASWAYSASRTSRGDKVAYLAFEGSREHLFYRNYIDINAMVVTTQLIKEVGGFDETLRRWMDHDLVLRMMAVATPIFMPFIGCEHDHPKKRKDAVSVKESARWQRVVHGKDLIDWDSEQSKKRVPGRVSVIIVTEQEFGRTIETVDSVLRDGGFDDVEIIVVDNGTNDDQALALAQHLPARDEVKLARLIRPITHPLANNYGFLKSTGEYILLLSASTRVREGSLQRLVLELTDESVAGVQPVLTYGDDTILSAGTVWATAESLPVRFLERHPLEDASYVDGYQFSAAGTEALMVRACDFHELRGFDHRYVAGMDGIDFSLRALELRSSGFRVVRESIVTCLDPAKSLREREASGDRMVFMERWQHRMPEPDREIYRKSGFDIGTDTEDNPVKIAGSAVTLQRRSNDGMRWGIKNPAKAGQPGDRWGDTHFIDSLSDSLRRLGQSVVTYRQPAHKSPVTALDDVSLVIRGLKQSHPVPGKVNVLWIISHPEKVTAAEIAGFDLVYAASTSWARWATEEYGVEVRPLLQATDSSRFNYQSTPQNPSTDVVFVGGRFKTRKRTAIADTLESGVKFKVYGPRWEGAIPDEVLAGDYVPNEVLADVYRDARFVLADHWDLMAREGFIQNRIFDAVASGCVVISDEVKDLRDTFGDEVLVAHGPDDIKSYVEQALTEDIEESQKNRHTASRNVLENHTFDARAKQLLADVMEWKTKNER